MVSHLDFMQGLLSHWGSDTFSGKKPSQKKPYHQKVNPHYLNLKCKVPTKLELPESLKPNIWPHFLRDKSQNTCGSDPGNLFAFFSAQLNQSIWYTLLLKALMLTPFELIKLPPSCVVLFPFSPLFPFNKLPAEAQEAGAVLLKVSCEC